MQTRTQTGIKKTVIVLASLLYAAAVVYGDIMFFTIVSRVFPNGLLGTLAMVGAFVAGGTALILPIALHWWHSRGTQQIAGYLFYAVDFVILAMNAMLAYQLIQNGHLDMIFSIWLTLCPATPLICAGGWALVFSLDSSHGMRHAQQDLEADQIETYAKGLRNAANSPQVKAIIDYGAQLHAIQHVQNLLGVNMPDGLPQPPALPAPTQHLSQLTSIPQSTLGRVFNQEEVTRMIEAVQAEQAKKAREVTGKIEAVRPDPLAGGSNGKAPEK